MLDINESFIGVSIDTSALHTVIKNFSENVLQYDPLFSKDVRVYIRRIEYENLCYLGEIDVIFPSPTSFKLNYTRKVIEYKFDLVENNIFLNYNEELTTSVSFDIPKKYPEPALLTSKSTSDVVSVLEKIYQNVENIPSIAKDPECILDHYKNRQKKGHLTWQRERFLKTSAKNKDALTKTVSWSERCVEEIKKEYANAYSSDSNSLGSVEPLEIFEEEILDIIKKTNILYLLMTK
jgi:hypothetical protein